MCLVTLPTVWAECGVWLVIVASPFALLKSKKESSMVSPNYHHDIASLYTFPSETIHKYKLQLIGSNVTTYLQYKLWTGFPV